MTKKKENVAPQETKVVVKKLSPFDIINYIFTNEEEFNKLSNLILEQNYFIINRTFSIKYPLQAQAFNSLGLNSAEVIRCWKQFLTSKEPKNKVPYWCYTKGGKRQAEQTEKTCEIKKLDKIEYAKYAGLSLKDVEDLIKFCPDALHEEIERVQKLHSVKEQEKNIKRK